MSFDINFMGVMGVLLIPKCTIKVDICMDLARKKDGTDLVPYIQAL